MDQPTPEDRQFVKRMYDAAHTNQRRLVEAPAEAPGSLAQARYVLQASGIELRRTEPGWRMGDSLRERSEPWTQGEPFFPLFHCSLPLAALAPRGEERARSSAAGGARSSGGRRRRRILDVRTADLQEEMTEQRFSVPSDPTKTAATQRTSRERSEQSNRA